MSISGSDTGADRSTSWGIYCQSQLRNFLFWSDQNHIIRALMARHCLRREKVQRMSYGLA